MNIKSTVLLVGIAIVGVRPCYAEDVSAAMATLQDAVAECRYLALKLEMQSRAQAVMRELTDLYTDALNKTVALPEGSAAREAQMTYAKDIEQTKDAALEVSLEADSDVLAVEKEIGARRGSLEQCKGDTEKSPIGTRGPDGVVVFHG